LWTSSPPFIMTCQPSLAQTKLPSKPYNYSRSLTNATILCRFLAVALVGKMPLIFLVFLFKGQATKTPMPFRPSAVNAWRVASQGDLHPGTESEPTRRR
jgi:hypothetical protein